MPTGVAVIGAGAIAHHAHFPAWSRDKRAALVCVADRDAAVAEQSAKAWGIAEWTSDYATVFDRPDVDVVDICTPASTHTAMICAALQAGKHVLVEKPVVPTVSDAIAVLEEARRSACVLMIAENWLFSSTLSLIREALASTPLGKPLLLYACHESANRVLRPHKCGKGDRDQLGILLTAGVHTLSLARELMGDVQSVFAYDTAADVGPAVDEDVVVATRFSSQALGDFHFTARAAMGESRTLGFRIVGTKAVIAFDIATGEVQIIRDGRREVAASMEFSPGYNEEIAHFLDCVESGSEPITSMAQQAWTLAFAQAVMTSSRTGLPTSPARLMEPLLSSASKGVRDALALARQRTALVSLDDSHGSKRPYAGTLQPKRI